MKRLILVLSALIAGAAPAFAEEWPARPLTLIVAFPAGGSDDILARLLAPFLSERLGQQVVVENIGGAGGMTGASRIAKAAPDGYQFMLGTSATHALSQALHKTPPYAATDFTPVMLLAEQPFILIARKDLPADGLKDFIAYAKTNEGKLSYGSAGAGSATHLVCALLTAAIGATAKHVSYDGGAAAMKDLIAGRIDYFCPVVTIAIPPIEKQQVKAAAILTRSRAAMLPGLATAQEQGLANFAANTWFAFFLPKGTPLEIVQKLHDASVAAIESPAVQSRLKEIGAEIVSHERRTPEYLGKFLQGEITKWSAAIKTAGLQPD